MAIEDILAANPEVQDDIQRQVDRIEAALSYQHNNMAVMQKGTETRLLKREAPVIVQYLGYGRDPGKPLPDHLSGIQVANAVAGVVQQATEAITNLLDTHCSECSPEHDRYLTDLLEATAQEARKAKPLDSRFAVHL